MVSAMVVLASETASWWSRHVVSASETESQWSRHVVSASLSGLVLVAKGAAADYHRLGLRGYLPVITVMLYGYVPV